MRHRTAQNPAQSIPTKKSSNHLRADYVSRTYLLTTSKGKPTAAVPRDRESLESRVWSENGQ